MRNVISGVIKLGQLKRIQAVLHRNHTDKNRFENRNWQEEISFIKKGRGNFIPVSVSDDFSDENLLTILSNEYLNANLINAKLRIETVLKLLVLDKS